MLVLVVVDTPGTWEAIRRQLLACDRAEIAGQASTNEAWELPHGASWPEVALVQVARSDGIAVDRVRELHDAGVPVIAVLSDITFAAEALRAGARGFIMVGDGHAWQPALDAVADGGMYIRPEHVAGVFFHDPATDAPVRSLTPREIEVLEMVAQGLTG